MQCSHIALLGRFSGEGRSPRAGAAAAETFCMRGASAPAVMLFEFLACEPLAQVHARHLAGSADPRDAARVSASRSLPPSALGVAARRAAHWAARRAARRPARLAAPLAAVLAVAAGTAAPCAAQTIDPPAIATPGRPQSKPPELTYVYDRATFAAGASPVAIAAADFDGDGRRDLVVANNQGGSLTVLRKGQHGGFQTLPPLPVGAEPNAVATADLDGDGAQDIVAVNQNCLSGTCGPGSAAVLLGHGDGSFASAFFVPTGTNPQSVAIGDFNGDRVPDLAVVNAVTIITQGPGTVSILLGLGNGSFVAAGTYPAGDGPLDIAAADFDEDGALDLAIVNSIPFVVAHAVALLRGNGDGSFEPPVLHTVGFGPAALVAADLDADGALDVATANLGDNSVSVLRGDGAGGFLPHVDFAAGFGPRSIDAADLDLDGTLDLALTIVGAQAGGGLLGVLRGLGGASFGPLEDYQAGALGLAVIAEDVDDDGWPDLVAPSSSGRVGVYLNQRDGTLYVPETLLAGSEPVAIVDADLDHDGHPDLLVANAFAQTFSVFLGLGESDGAFAPRVDFAAGGEPRDVATGDLNNDGHLDVVLANGGGTLAVRIGDGAGGFGPLKSYAAGPPDALAIADFDGDGLRDVAAASSQANVVSILLGKGHGLLGNKTDIAAGPLPIDLVHGDFDGDGLLDLAVADQTSGSFGPGKLAFLRGHGDGSFNLPVLYNAGVEADSLAQGDFDHDGDLDLAVAVNLDVFGSVAILLNNGNGTFAPQVLYPTGRLASDVVVGDFDRDHQPDLAIPNAFNATATILRGQGDGTFELLAQYAPGLAPVALTAGEFDGDGALDLAVVDLGADAVRVLLSR